MRSASSVTTRTRSPGLARPDRPRLDPAVDRDRRRRAPGGLRAGPRHQTSDRGQAQAWLERHRQLRGGRGEGADPAPLHLNDNAGGDTTVVTYSLQPAGDGTRFTYEHTGFTGVGGLFMAQLLGRVRRKMLSDGLPAVLADMGDDGRLPREARCGQGACQAELDCETARPASWSARGGGARR